MGVRYKNRVRENAPKGGGEGGETRVGRGWGGGDGGCNKGERRIDLKLYLLGYNVSNYSHSYRIVTTNTT